MALLNPTEFAGKCGLTSGNLSNYKNRGKAVTTDDGLYDDQNPTNVLFLAKCEENAQKRLAKGEKSGTDLPEKTAKMEEFPGKTPVKAPKKSEKRDNAGLNAQLDQKFTVENDLKRKQADRQEAEARLLKLKEDRITGQLVPTAIIKPLFQTHFQSLTREMQNMMNALITDISAKSKLNRNVQAEMRRKAINEINLAVDRSIFQSEREVDQIIKDYSGSKS